MKRQLKKLYIFFATIVLINGCTTFSGPSYVGPVSDHFDGEKFYNQVKTEKEVNFFDIMKWLATRKRGNWPNWVEDTPGPKPPARVGHDSLLVTYINHATALLQYNNMNVLTDPNWAIRNSPVSFAGPVRHRPPGIRFEDLPPIDLVLISHNHYDHLELSTLKRLQKKFNPLIIVPLGNKSLLENEGITNVIEMDWWDNIKVKNYDVTFAPARHQSMRGFFDHNETLWGSYVLETSAGPIYFAGDTGYGPHFKELGKKYEYFRFSLIPIGPIHPRWLMESVHINPEEAVLAHKELNSRLSLPIHFGTFQQAEDEINEPIVQLVHSILEYNVDPKSWIMPATGRGVWVEPINYYENVTK